MCLQLINKSLISKLIMDQVQYAFVNEIINSSNVDCIIYFKCHFICYNSDLTINYK